jgi:outer membrane lipoprotein carrier protein
MTFKTTYKTLLFLCMVTLHAASLFANQQSQPSRAYEEKGAQLMKNASEKLKSLSSLKIDFTYVMENSTIDIHEKMEGSLVSKGDKYRMHVGDNLFISDGETVWSYMEDIDEVHINHVENTEGALTPTSLLEEFDTQFRSTFIRQEQHLGRLVDIIDLIPHNAQVFFKYRVAIDSNTNMMAYAIAYDRHGGTYTYTVNRYENNLPIPDSNFSFSPSTYPGVEIIDLR